MQDMESHGCTHTIVIDADEYYNRDSFLSALQTIDDNNYDLTYCQYANYYKDYNTFLIYPFEEGMFVPFVSRAHYRFTFNGTDFDKPSDPTRRFVRIKNNGKYIDSMYIFAWKELKMHHLSWCRISCSAKLSAWSSKKLFNNHNNLIDRAIYDFEHYEEKQPDSVHIIFNVPGNLVKVKRINHAFISPERDINYYRHYYYTLKKAIVLNMSTTYSDGLYTRLEQCCRETWAGPILNNEYQNISYWSVTDTESDSYIDNDSHTVYIKNKAEGIETSFETLTHKFIQAIKML